MIVDEIKTGGGRTGKFLYTHSWPLKPDIVTMSKALCGGLPFSAVLSNTKTFEGIDHGWHSSTMGGNPAFCRYSTYLLKRITNASLAGVVLAGEHLQNLLNVAGYEWVGSGLHINVFVNNAMAVRDQLIAKGILVYCIGDEYVALYPNIFTSLEQIELVVNALSETRSI
jgi:acetylornithine/succinyldiaminopimelate/putrescine aminotransferase